MAEKRIIKFELTAKQALFCRARKKHIAYGGARGGGKSWIVRYKACRMARRFGRPDPYSQGIRICIVRRTLEDLRKNHLDQLKLMLTGLAKYVPADRRFVFDNGATIKLEYCDNAADIEHFQGVEYDIIFIEEATQFEPEWLKQIAASCRGANDFPHRIYYTCNPGGPGHAYIKRLFVDRIFEGRENPDDYEFIQAKVTDNKVLMEKDPDYIGFLENLPPKLRKAWLEGDWNVYEGQFFEEFRNDPEHYEDRLWTHVISPFKRIPRHWPIYRSFDWGYAKPFSNGWYTIDEDGTIYRFLELYGVQKSGNASLPDVGVKWPSQRIFLEIRKMEEEHPLLEGREIFGVADSAIWDDSETGKSIADTAASLGIYYNPSKKKRIPGWMQCHYRLQFDKEGRARFYVTSNCTEFIRTIPTLQYDKNKAEDLDSNGEDHAADEWRYLMMENTIEPIVEIEEKEPAWGADPLGTMMKGRREW